MESAGNRPRARSMFSSLATPQPWELPLMIAASSCIARRASGHRHQRAGQCHATHEGATSARGALAACAPGTAGRPWTPGRLRAAACRRWRPPGASARSAGPSATAAPPRRPCCSGSAAPHAPHSANSTINSCAGSNRVDEALCAHVDIKPAAGQSISGICSGSTCLTVTIEVAAPSPGLHALSPFYNTEPGILAVPQRVSFPYLGHGIGCRCCMAVCGSAVCCQCPLNV